MQLNLFKKFYIVFIVAVLLIYGCAKVALYTPTEKVSSLSKAITREEAISLLNNNVKTPKKHYNERSISSMLESEHCYMVGFNDYICIDGLTTVKFVDEGFIFFKLFKAGELIEAHGDYETYEKERYNSEVQKYSDVRRVTKNIWYDLDDEEFCNSGSSKVGISVNAFIPFLFCIENEEEFYAAVIKLMPQAEIKIVTEK